MAMDPESVGAFAKIADWVIALFSGIVAAVISVVTYIFKSFSRRLSALENTAVRKDEFARYEDRADTTRRELRDGIIALHEKVENSSRDLENKLDSLIRHLLEKK